MGCGEKDWMRGARCQFYWHTIWVSHLFKTKDASKIRKPFKMEGWRLGNVRQWRRVHTARAPRLHICRCGLLVPVHLWRTGTPSAQKLMQMCLLNHTLVPSVAPPARLVSPTKMLAISHRRSSNYASLNLCLNDHLHMPCNRGSSESVFWLAFHAKYMTLCQSHLEST